MYFTKTPKIISSILKDVVWNITDKPNCVYLTFDDGPTPQITEKTLQILASENVKATFFCLGIQAEKYPFLLEQIKAGGHCIGNHSYSHPKGWTTNNQEYFNDIDKAQLILNSTLLRPPYGKIKRSQVAGLKEKYKIVMWDVLPGDFSPKNSVKDIVHNTVSNAVSGSIIVLHDNDKCGTKMNQALPAIIQQLKHKGFSFDTIK